MSNVQMGARRYFSTYSGIKLPFKLSQELEESAIQNRNTYFLGYFDEQGRMTGFQKLVYGEVELEHRYEFDAQGGLTQAEITNLEGEITVMRFDQNAA
jgi:hypothetical protein